MTLSTALHAYNAALHVQLADIVLFAQVPIIRHDRLAAPSALCQQQPFAGTCARPCTGHDDVLQLRIPTFERVSACVAFSFLPPPQCIQLTLRRRQTVTQRLCVVVVGGGGVRGVLFCDGFAEKVSCDSADWEVPKHSGLPKLRPSRQCHVQRSASALQLVRVLHQWFPWYVGRWWVARAPCKPTRICLFHC